MGRMQGSEGLEEEGRAPRGDRLLQEPAHPPPASGVLARLPRGGRRPARGLQGPATFSSSSMLQTMWAQAVKISTARERVRMPYTWGTEPRERAHVASVSASADRPAPRSRHGEMGVRPHAQGAGSPTRTPRASPTTNTAGRRVARPARARPSKRRPALGRRGAGRGGLTRQHGARVAGPTPVTWVCNLCGAGPWADAVTDGFPILSRGGRALGATTGREAGGGARASGARGTVGQEGRDVGHRASLGHSAEANGLRRV